MSHLTCCFSGARTVLLTVFFAFSFSAGLFAQSVPTKAILRYETPPISSAQENAEQLLYIERGASAESHRTRTIVNAALAMFLFGSFCALWAQNTGRNSLLWFLLGFAFTLGAILFILWLNRRPPKKKRPRRNRYVKDYWRLGHL